MAYLLVIVNRFRYLGNVISTVSAVGISFVSRVWKKGVSNECYDYYNKSRRIKFLLCFFFKQYVQIISLRLCESLTNAGNTFWHFFLKSRISIHSNFSIFVISIRQYLNNKNIKIELRAVTDTPIALNNIHP